MMTWLMVKVLKVAFQDGSNHKPVEVAAEEVCTVQDLDLVVLR